ncbi:MAG: transporter substrate-binding domain-containing protein [Pseudolabrys sp.]|nr:transporter substrate-binding domain-containing protein [Pseudolabrys sp.]
MIAKHAISMVLLALLAGTVTAGAQQSTDTRIADLVQSGTLRVGLFLPQYTKDAATGALKGVWAENARALGARIGIPVALLEHPTPPQAIDCLKTQACDLLFLPFDARSASVGDFSPPIFQFDYTLLVAANASIAKVSDADRSGIRIAAVRNHASTNELGRLVKVAQFVYAETPDQTFELLRSGQADAMASARPTLLNYAAKLPGAHVLQDRYGANVNRMVVPKGKAGWLAYVSEFVEDAKASGDVQKAIDRGGPPGVTVAPPGDVK